MPWLLASRTSAAMILIMLNRQVLVLLEEEFQLHLVILMWRNDIKCKYMFMFSLKNLARKWLSYWPIFTAAQLIWFANNYNPKLLGHFVLCKLNSDVYAGLIVSSYT